MNKVYYSLRKPNPKGYFIDYRVIKIKGDYISQYLLKDCKTWARLSSHIGLESAIKRIEGK